MPLGSVPLGWTCYSDNFCAAGECVRSTCAIPCSSAYDVSECEFYAQAVSMAESAQSNDTYIGVSPTGDVVATQVPGTDALRYMRQGNAFARCMASRGYSQAAN